MWCKNLPAETMSALQPPTLPRRTTESLLITAESVLTMCLKVICRRFGLSCTPTSQATHKLRLALSHVLSTRIHTHMHTKYTDSHGLCYFQQYSAHYPVLRLTGTSVVLRSIFLFHFPLLYSSLYSIIKRLFSL